MKKLLALVLALVLTVAAASFAQAEEETIRVYTHMGAQIEAIKDAFEAANPGVKVTVDNCPYESLNDQIAFRSSIKTRR